MSSYQLKLALKAPARSSVRWRLLISQEYGSLPGGPQCPRARAQIAFTSKLDHQPTYPINQNSTSTQPQQGPASTKAVALSGTKQSPCPEKSCHYPRFWPDSHCLKTSKHKTYLSPGLDTPNIRTPCPPFSSNHLPSDYLIPSTYHRTASARPLHPRLQSNQIPGLKLTCLTPIYRMYSTLPPGSSLPARITLPDPPSKLFVKF